MKNKGETISNRKLTALKVFIGCIAIFCALDCNGTLFIYEKIFVTKNNLHRSLQGKRIWVTGASSGIGAEFVKQLGESGAHMVLSSRRREKLEEVASNLNLDSKTTSIVAFDITGSTNEIQNAVDQVLREGGIDILILNAAVFQERPALKTSIQETKELMKVNYEGPVELANELIIRDRWQQKKRGHIMVMSSRFGKLPGPLSSSYCATKHALHGYFSSLNVELPWLRVDFALPGPVATNLYKDAKKQIGKQSFYGSWDRQMMTPERVAGLIIAGMTGPAVLFHEMWISKPIALFGYYQQQYAPLWASSSHAAFGRFAVNCHEHGFEYCLKLW